MTKIRAVLTRLVLAAALVCVAGTAAAAAGGGRAVSHCAPMPYDQAYVDGVQQALAQRQAPGATRCWPRPAARATTASARSCTRCCWSASPPG